MGQFGQELRKEREDRGVTVAQICAVTKVSSRHVEALEAGRYDDMPGGVFRKGIVRSYVSVVGLDEAPWVQRFEASLREAGTDGSEQQDWVEFAENVRKNRGIDRSTTGLRWLGVAMMLMTLSVCAFLVWQLLLRGKVSL